MIKSGRYRPDYFHYFCDMRKFCLLIALLLAAGSVSTAQERIGLYIGTFGNAIYEATFDSNAGKLEVTDKIEAVDPSYLCAGKKALYSVSEHQGHPGIYSFRPDGKKSYLDRIGDSPCFITELKSGKHVATADYNSGTISVFRQRNGLLKKNVQTLSYEPHSHIHQLKYIPGTTWLLATDLGDDCIHILKPSHGRKPLKDVAAVRDGFPKGCGPRHMEFNPGKQILYCICELSDEVIVFHYDLDGKTPQFTHLQTLRANEVKAGGSADIHLDPSGTALFTSHRLKNEGVATFLVGNDGLLEKVDYTPTGGHPRNFLPSPDGKWVLVACRDDASVEIYSRDVLTGLLSPYGKTGFGDDKPCCIILK